MVPGHCDEKARIASPQREGSAEISEETCVFQYLTFPELLVLGECVAVWTSCSGIPQWSRHPMARRETSS